MLARPRYYQSDLQLRFLDGRRWELVREFSLLVEGRTYTVPAGFVTDFASSPRFFWRVLPPVGLYVPAAILHDWLYSLEVVPAVSRRAADRAFRAAMEARGVPAWQRWALWLAVRLFGGRHFRRD